MSFHSRTLHFLNPFNPVPGAVKYSIRLAEVARSVVSGSAIFALISVLQFVAANVDMFSLPDGISVLVSTIIGGVVALLQLGLQLFQGKTPPPTPAPVLPPAPTPAPGPQPVPDAPVARSWPSDE